MPCLVMSCSALQERIRSLQTLLSIGSGSPQAAAVLEATRTVRARCGTCRVMKSGCVLHPFDGTSLRGRPASSLIRCHLEQPRRCMPLLHRAARSTLMRQGHDVTKPRICRSQAEVRGRYCMDQCQRHATAAMDCEVQSWVKDVVETGAVLVQERHCGFDIAVSANGRPSPRTPRCAPASRLPPSPAA